MADIWYRGESTAGVSSKPGANLHDFGDGVYYTNRLDVAIRYAETRVLDAGGQPRVVTVAADGSQLGRVLDLNADARWTAFLQRRVTPNSPTFEQLIRAANENYGRFFSDFAKENKVDLRAYDAVMGPEFVRGGTQLCLLQHGEGPSPIAQQFRRLQREVPRTVSLKAANVNAISGSELLTPNSRLRRAAGNQAAVAMLGQAIALALEQLGDAGIRHRIESAVDDRLAPGIRAALARRKGVLVVSTISEADWQDFNGVRSRLYLNSFIQEGMSLDDALTTWRTEPKLMQGAGPNAHIVEQYLWIDPR